MTAATYAPVNREQDDFYATPRSAVAQLLEVEQFSRCIWEPACGDGAVSKVLQERGHTVFSTDLVDRGYGDRARHDFLLDHTPFKLGTEFARHALALSSRKVALLLKIGFLEGPTKADLHARLSRIWVIRRRVTFLKGGHEHVRSAGKGGIHTYAWFVWDTAHTGPAETRWLEGEPCK